MVLWLGKQNQRWKQMVDAGAAMGPKKSAEPRRLLLLALTIAGGCGGGLIAAVAFAAWARSGVGDIPAFVIGVLCAGVLPLVLSIRATLALKKKKPSVLLRRVVALFLVVLIQFTVFLAGFVNLGMGSATTTAELAAAAVTVFGAVPGLGGMLEKAATDGGALDVKTPKGPNGPNDPVDVTKGSTAVFPHAGAVASGLSPRTGGRVIHALAAGVQTTEGNIVIVSWSLAFGGETRVRTIDLKAYASLGIPTRVEVADDGGLAVVLGGAQVIVVKAGTTAAEHDKALSRGSRVGDLEIQQVKDIAIAPGGAVLMSVDAFDSKKGAVRQALIARAVGGVPFAARTAGDVVDTAATPGDLPNSARGYAIKSSDGSGAVVVEEEFLAGGVDVGTRLSGPQWTLNPRRLLGGQIDNPRALVELARSGVEPSGVEHVSLQAFGDAALLPDGRCFFDANYREEGARGWLFSTRSGGGIFTVSPELVAKPEAPFAERAPRTRHLSVEAEGNFVFVNRDGALLLGNTSRLQDARVVLTGVAVRPADGSRAGGIASVQVPRLARGGDWVVASVELLADGGARTKALVLASKADLAAGTAEVLLEQGGLLPAAAFAAAPGVAVDDKLPKNDGTTLPPAPPASPAPPAPARVKSIFFFDGHDEALWQAR